MLTNLADSVNPRWRHDGDTVAAKEGHQGDRSSSSSSDSRADLIDVPGHGGGTLPRTHDSSSRSSWQKSSKSKSQRRGSWAIDVPNLDLESDDGGLESASPSPPPPSSAVPAAKNNPADEANRTSSSFTTQTTVESARFGSLSASTATAASSVRDTGLNRETSKGSRSSNPSSSRDLYENARKNLFGSGGNGLGSGLGASSSHSSHSYDHQDSACDWDLSDGLGSSTRSGAAVNVPAWMKDKVKREQEVAAAAAAAAAASATAASTKYPRNASFTMPLSNNDSDESSETDNNNNNRRQFSRRNSSDLRRERRSKSTWRLKSRRRTSCASADDAQDPSLADRLDDLYDAEDGLRGFERRRDGGDVEQDHDLDNDMESSGILLWASTRADLGLGAKPSSGSGGGAAYHHRDDGNQRSAQSLDLDVGVGRDRSSPRSSSTRGGHRSGRFAAPKREASGKDMQEVQFAVNKNAATDDHHNGTNGNATGAVRDRYCDSSVSCDLSTASTDRLHSNEDDRVRISVSPTSPYNAKSSFDFNSLRYQGSHGSHIFHQQHRISWCRLATICTVGAVLLVACISASQSLFGSSSSASSLQGASSGGADLSSVVLPGYIESNLADWSDVSSVQGSRQRRAWKVQGKNADDVDMQQPGDVETPEVVDVNVDFEAPLDSASDAPDAETEEEEDEKLPQDSAQQDVPFLWRIPFSGSTETEEVFGQCLGLIQASDLGIADGHDSDPSLATVDIRGVSYINVDTTTRAGIQHAKELRLLESGLPDVVATPLLHDVAKGLFDPSHRGRALAVLRHPVDRAMATYHYLTMGRFHGPDGQELDQLSTKTLQEYAESEFCDDNWLTRTLVNKPDGPLKEKDLILAKAILRRKAVVGLYSDLASSIHHFATYFGWEGASSSLSDCASELIGKAHAREQEDFPELDFDSPAYETILEKNEYDIQLYEYATELREQQSSLI